MEDVRCDRWCNDAVGYQLVKEWEPFFKSANLDGFQGDNLRGAELSQKAYEYVGRLGVKDSEQVVAFAKKAAAWAKDAKNNVAATKTAIARPNQDSTKYEAKFEAELRLLRCLSAGWLYGKQQARHSSDAGECKAGKDRGAAEERVPHC